MNKRFEFDSSFLKDFNYLIGADEAGRGPGAGGVFAAAVCFPSVSAELHSMLEKLNDSKQVTEKERENLYEIIVKNSIWSVQTGSIEDIERINILRASLFAMQKCIEDVISKLPDKNAIVLIDGSCKIYHLPYEQKAVIKGDEKSAAIAAASIIAKVSRDRYMIELDKEFPMYNWRENKGYMTPEHLEAVNKYGLCKYHRKQFFEKFLDKSAQLSLF